MTNNYNTKNINYEIHSNICNKRFGMPLIGNFVYEIYLAISSSVYLPYIVR